MKQIALLSLAGALLAACATPAESPAPEAPAAMPEAPATPEAPAAKVAPGGFDYESVFRQDDRPEQDYELYPVRKSAEVLSFAGVMPGMTIVEMEAGDGFYTELLSRVAGPDGKVYMQNPPSFKNFLGDSVSKRVDGRLLNVQIVESAFDNLSNVPDADADIVTWFLGPHELWYTPQGEPEGVLGDPDMTFDEIARVLKPGGHLVMLDHMAPAGSPPTTGGDTHRIDKAIIVALAEDHGLTLVDESGILANPDDDGTVQVFDPSVRRKTDRFLLKFAK
ncbi:MAG: class I SAM-dependent methyltransferase [Hyphomonas sp.]|nr:class I SAM-dependent methyltransferase [Hyphomonas sp.]